MENQKIFFLSFVLSAFMTLPAASDIIYVNNFENPSDPLTEWSNNPQHQDTTPGTVQHPVDRFLGQFTGNDSTELTLNNIPSWADKVMVSFDLYLIRTWDGHGATSGPDIWNLNIPGGPTLVNTTFSNMEEHGNSRQAFPDKYPGGNFDPRTGSYEKNTLGFVVFNYDHEIMDTVYHFYCNDSFTFPHSASSLKLKFSGIGLQSEVYEGWYDESWGIDNVRIEAIPEPCTLSLLFLGGLAILRKRKL